MNLKVRNVLYEIVDLLMELTSPTYEETKEIFNKILNGLKRKEKRKDECLKCVI